MTSTLTSPCSASVADKTEVDMSRVCEARVLCQSLTQSLSDGSRSDVLMFLLTAFITATLRVRDVTKFAFEFDNVQTSNVFSRFEIRRIFSFTRRRIRTSGLHDRRHMSTPTLSLIHI